MYDFYNKRYGIKLKLTLDEDEDREELRYQCFSIKDEYRDSFDYKCRNGWKIKSNQCPAIAYSTRRLWLQGRNHNYDDIIVIIDKDKRYTLFPNSNEKCYIDFGLHAAPSQIYHELIDVLEELGNDFSQANAFLDM